MSVRVVHACSIFLRSGAVIRRPFADLVWETSESEKRLAWITHDSSHFPDLAFIDPSSVEAVIFERVHILASIAATVRDWFSDMQEFFREHWRANVASAEGNRGGRDLGSFVAPVGADALPT
jgi:hypothetical protein